MKRASVAPDKITYNSLLHHCINAGQLARAFEVVDEMRAAGVPLDLFAYTTLINGCAKASDIDRAFELLAEMRAAGIVPDQVLYTSLMRCCCVVGQLSRAFGFVDDMHNSGIKPDAVFYNALIRECLAVDDVAGARKALSMLCAAASPSPAPSTTPTPTPPSSSTSPTSSNSDGNVTRPNMYSFKMLIMYLCDHEQVEAACELVAEMQSLGLRPDTYTYNSLLKGLMLQSTPVQHAMPVLESMYNAGLAPNRSTYTLLLAACTESGQIDIAIKLLEQLRASGIEFDFKLYHQLVRCFARNGHLARAHAFLREMQRRGGALAPTIATYSIMLRAMVDHDDLSCVESVLKDMVAAGVQADVLLYNHVLNGLTRHSHEVDRAYAILMRMLQPGGCGGVRPDVVSCNTLIQALVRNHRQEHALALLQHHMRDANIAPDLTTFNTLIHGHCNAGQLDQVHQRIKDMQALGIKPDLVTFNTMIRGMLRVGQGERAYALFLAMPMPPDHRTFLMLLIGTREILRPQSSPRGSAAVASSPTPLQFQHAIERALEHATMRATFELAELFLWSPVASPDNYKAVLSPIAAYRTPEVLQSFLDRHAQTIASLLNGKANSSLNLEATTATTSTQPNPESTILETNHHVH